MIKRPDGSFESDEDRKKRERQAKDNERMAAMERAIRRKKLMAEAGEVSPEEAAYVNSGRALTDNEAKKRLEGAYQAAGGKANYDRQLTEKAAQNEANRQMQARANRAITGTYSFSGRA